MPGFKIRDTSSAFQPLEELERELERENEEHKSSKKSKKKGSKSVNKTRKKPSTNGGFQVKHDPTNQADYY
jgi:hypothetical protein